MPFNFPLSPSIGQESVQNGRNYRWTGSAWEIAATSIQGPQGFTGSQGVQGVQGITGTTGSTGLV